MQTTYNGIEYIGSFTADGNGNITGGELDINDPNTGITSYSTLGGTYDIQYGWSTRATTRCPDIRPAMSRSFHRASRHFRSRLR